jgi:bacillithiol biosynthesis deacetylase BshB1
MQLDLIAFGAHPDDVELFCGGTLLKLTKNGLKTGVVDLTLGELSTRGNPELRNTEAEHARSILNVTVRENLAIPDGNIENSAEHRLRIIKTLRTYRPPAVLIPYWKDRHPDHVNAARLLQEAVFFAGLKQIDTGTPAFRPTHMIYYFHHEVATPSFVVDISEEFETKMKAIKSYKSQFYNPDSSEPETYISSQAFEKSIAVRAQYFGFQIGVRYGEPFLVKEPLKINNLSDIFA